MKISLFIGTDIQADTKDKILRMKKDSSPTPSSVDR